MTETTIRGLRGEAPTDHAEMLAWIAEVAELTQPDAVVFADGSDEEWDRITSALVESGTFVKLNEEKKPNSFYAASDPKDVARVESRTFICSRTEDDAGPTNNWRDPDQMREELRELFAGSMRGRTMYVIPYCMGPLESDDPKLGIELTDSAYVVASMRIMTRMGRAALDKIGRDGEYVKGLHSVGVPLEPGEEDVPWPCNETKYISHFPEDREIWSFGSGYGGNALLGKKCFALRIASAIAHDEGWMAEHMLILKLTSPEDKVYYVVGAFPSATGKTNLAMIQPTLEGWKAEVVGDDIAWLRFGEDGRLYAVNPEYGFFGVAPGTNYSSNPNAMYTLEGGNSIYTNVALTDDNDVWWEGLEGVPEHLTDWLGNEWTPAGDGQAGNAAHPNSRYCTPIEQCPVTAPEFNSPEGVPISAILFGGRRADTVPLVSESRSWEHGVYLGATLSSGQTAAAEGVVGTVRRDPMAMLPFLGYNVGDYFRHWLNMGAKGGDKMPRIYLVNWFRKSDDGRIVWPGFGENSRVLKWIVDRLEGRVGADDTVVGRTARAEDIDMTGLDTPMEDVRESLAVSDEEWRRELPLISEWLESCGSRVPQEIFDEFEGLKSRLG